MILRLSSALICLLLVASSVNAQCSSCSQTAAPAFGQSVAAPMYASMNYAQPVSGYQHYAAPIQSGCMGCGTSACSGMVNQGCGCSAPMTYTSAPVMSAPAMSAPMQSGCSGCAQTMAPQMTYTSAPVSVAPIQSGCSSCASNVGTYSAAPAVDYGYSNGCESNCSSCNTGCNQCCANSAPATRNRVVRLGGRRSNCCY